MKVSDWLKGLVIILSAGMIVVSGLYIDLLREQSLADETLKSILQSPKPESGEEIYNDLTLINCKIRQLEVYPHPCDIELTDYSAFLIMAKGRDVEMGHEFSFEWNPSCFTWEEDIKLYVKTPYGIVGWEATFTTHEFISGISHKERYRSMIARKLEIINERSPFDIEHTLGRQEAITLSVYFLDDIGYRVGKLLSAELETKDPNFYWHELAKLEKPDIRGPRLCWVVRGTREYRPGYPREVYEIWVDAYTGEVIGGNE